MHLGGLSASRFLSLVHQLVILADLGGRLVEAALWVKWQHNGTANTNHGCELISVDAGGAEWVGRVEVRGVGSWPAPASALHSIALAYGWRTGAQETELRCLQGDRPRNPGYERPGKEDAEGGFVWMNPLPRWLAKHTQG